MAECCLLLVFVTLVGTLAQGVPGWEDWDTSGKEHSNATAYKVTHVSFELSTNVLLGKDVDATTFPPERSYYSELYANLSYELTNVFESDTSVDKIMVIGIRLEDPITVDFYMWSSTVLERATVEDILNKYYIDKGNNPVKDGSLNVDVGSRPLEGTMIDSDLKDHPCETSCDAIECLKESNDDCVVQMVHGLYALYPHLYRTDGKTTPASAMTTAMPNVEGTKYESIGSSGQKDDQKVTSTSSGMMSSGDADMTDMPTSSLMTDENLATSSNCGENCGMRDDTQSQGTVTVPGEDTGGSNTNGGDITDENDGNVNTGGCIEGEGGGCQGKDAENATNAGNQTQSASSQTEPDDSTAFPYKIVIPVSVVLFFFIIIIIIIIVIQKTKQPVTVAPAQ